MDQGLKATIHRYAENREIDYMSAKNLGIAYGINFKNEQDLVEFKTLIDTYLKTFKEDAFDAVEEACKSKNKKKKKEVVEEESDICPACGEHVSSPGKQSCPLKSKHKKKAVKESYEYTEPATPDSKLRPTKPVTKKSGKKAKKKKTVKESNSLADMFKID